MSDSAYVQSRATASTNMLGVAEGVRDGVNDGVALAVKLGVKDAV